MIRRLDLEQIIQKQAKEMMQEDAKEIERNILSLSVTSGFAHIITGIRRCGKSTMMRQIMHKNKERKSVYLNFDDIRLSSFDKSDFVRLHEIIVDSDIQVLFFDEIQLVSGWEVFIHQLLRESHLIYITGSNASLLSVELGTHLTGRHLNFELFPFSYPEYLQYMQTSASAKSLREYLEQGGMPEYLRTRNIQVIQSLIDDILMRDIAVRRGIRDVSSLRQLAVYLLTNTTKLFSATSLAKTLRLKAVSTILEYIGYMRDAYLIDIIGQYSCSLKATTRNPKKVYAIDNGFITAMTVSQTEDSGRLLENMVYICLRQKYANHIYYYHNSGECDFIITDINNHPKEAIQVCYEITSENFDREIRGLSEAMRELKLSTGIILTMNEKDTLDIPEGCIQIIPVHQWCLSFKLKS